eukprot:15479976-Alexandrium_andersonii.AAC.1
MTPNPPDEDLQGAKEGSVRPPSARYGLWSARVYGVPPDYSLDRIAGFTHHSRTWDDLYQTRCCEPLAVIRGRSNCTRAMPKRLARVTPLSPNPAGAKSEFKVPFEFKVPPC